MNSKYSYAELLFARPSALEGAASPMDLSGSLFSEYNDALSGEQADTLALASDWRAVGDELRIVMRQFAAEHRLSIPDEPANKQL
ncbi:MAG TPA: hypothetical protein VFJ58_19525 [Armatimonadota bacterium]|nr:hypothetical protein [Armatimonadota bacterium]